MDNPGNKTLRILSIPWARDARDPPHRLLMNFQFTYPLAELSALLPAYIAIRRLLLTKAIHACLSIWNLVWQRPLSRQEFIHVRGGLGCTRRVSIAHSEG